MADVEQAIYGFGATDVGLYVSLMGRALAKYWNKGLPQVQISDMKIHEKKATLVLATFGRNAVDPRQSFNPLREMAKVLTSEKGFPAFILLLPMPMIGILDPMTE